ncbi:hypothetical protein [Candidatus Nephthysia bennettiae]|uniref:Uncharacterized protein n=1 Tax=Candidatus Nephthysia bennettiae TaxID=3127016 RepID=A0A934K1S7_9BACT|nr:hypothetical protein [Candidatus Dormibacteraeota bacterium]
MNSIAHHRRVPILAVCAALSIAQLFVATPVRAADATLSKSGQDTATGSTTQTTHGGNVNWVLNYANGSAGGPAQAAITDPVQTGQTYVPGSFQAPPGWTREWSPDGTNYQATEPATVQAVRASATVNNPATDQTVDLPRPPVVAAIFAGSGGDGWRPISYRGKIYNIFHHRDSRKPGISCADPLTGRTCPGYPTYVSSQAGAPLGTGPNDLDSTFALNDEFVDRTGQFGRRGNVYYPAQQAGTQKLGVACVNLEASNSCGFTVIDPAAGVERTVNPPNGENSIQASGGVQFGGRYYMYGVNAKLYCMDIATRTPCAGQPFGLGLPAAFTGVNANGGGGGGRFGAAGNIASHLIGGKIILLASYDNLLDTAGSGLGDRIACFDPTTEAVCSGFTQITIPNTTGNALTNPQPANADVVFTMTRTLNSSGQENGFCVYAFNGASTPPRHGLECWNLDGASVTPPAVLNATIGTLVTA